MFIKIVSDLHFDRPWAAKGSSYSGLWMPDFGGLNPQVVLCIVGDLAKKTWLDTPEGAGWLDELKRKNFKAAIFTMGNNEFWDGGPFLRCDYSQSVSEFRARSQPESGIYMLENESIEIENVAFFASCFWSDFRGDARLMAKKLDSEAGNEPFLQMTPAQLADSAYPTPQRLALESRKTRELVFDRPWGAGKRKLVLAHHPPIEECQDLSNMDAESWDLVHFHTNALGDRIKASDIDFWFYGHNHHRFRTKIGNTTVMSEPAHPSWSNPDYADGPDNLLLCARTMDTMSISRAKVLSGLGR